jgi:hypothetical protein
MEGATQYVRVGNASGMAAIVLQMRSLAMLVVMPTRMTKITTFQAAVAKADG